jgi:hypothetical protein
MDDEPSVFKKYIADTLETVTDGPKNITDGPEKERQIPAKIKPRRAIPRLVDPKNFIVDVLTNGPVPTKNILARGAQRGLTKRQITWAKENLDIIAFKETGPRGPWFWTTSDNLRQKNPKNPGGI